MNPEIEKLASSPAFQSVLQALQTKTGKKLRLSVGGLWGSSQGFFCAALSQQLKTPLLILLSDPEEAELFSEDLRWFGVTHSLFPSEDSANSEAEALGKRLQLVEKLSRGQAPHVIVSSLLALLQPVPNPNMLRESLLRLVAGATFDSEEFLEKLKTAGYRQKPFVNRPGEMSVRGAILDFFPHTASEPLRLEAFESKIESIRSFDPESQRSRNVLDHFEFFLNPVEKEIAAESLLSDFLGDSQTFVTIEPLRIQEREKSLRLQSDDFARSLDPLIAKWEASCIELNSLPGASIDFDTRSVQALGVGLRGAGEALKQASIQTPHIYLLCRNEAEQKRVSEVLRDQGIEESESIHIQIGGLSTGFRIPSLGATFLNHNELIGIPRNRRPTPLRRDLPTQVIRSFLDLNEGDLVVHEIHGVGKFLGTQRVQKGEGSEDHLVVEFAEESKLFVPSSRIDLIQKYVGAGGVEPRLDKIGSGSFQKRKEQVQKALIDLAAELLEIQALRESREGTNYPPDDEMQRDFEAAFPFSDTDDQISIMQEIKHDLESHRPMDRLVCGDVGYGKTELAIRAAFKVASAGKQVAVLVPTTILAEQHGQTFRERFADYPIEIASLSRFRSEKEQKKIVDSTREGKIDILIGTHRLLSGDIAFKDLGLVVIDEEQKFGVRHKEKLKQLRATVDVLTLTATPIPRTLHMSLVGIRDISSLTTPPPGRESVETLIRFKEDDAVIQQAMLKELNRGGQIFFLHNRVHSIGRTAKRVQDLVPEAKIGVGHGQMPEHELEEVMKDFVSGKTDVLVSTAIIESGLDIPRANTIFIDDAHMFGLADLHQLRGRVGRWKYKAHCYLLVSKVEPLSPESKARLKAIEELQDLGSGFAIAMRDLEIRGTGNILGAQQSGHIGAVGYDMYCKLLRSTVQRMKPQKGDKIEKIQTTLEPVDLELSVAAFLPNDYISDRKTKIGVLRELDEIVDFESREKARASLRDRFGLLPKEAERLLDLFWIKRALAKAGIRSVHFQKDRLLIEYRDRLRLTWALRETFPDIRYVEANQAHAILPGSKPNAEKALEFLKKSSKSLEKLELNLAAKVS